MFGLGSSVRKVMIYVGKIKVGLEDDSIWCGVGEGFVVSFCFDVSE